MKRLTNGLTLGIALTLLGASTVPAQPEGDRVEEASDPSVVPSAGMADFLRSEAAETHCCTIERFLEGAVLYKRAAEHGLDGNPENLDKAVKDLKLAGYFFYYAGAFDRAFNALARVGVIERDRGNLKEASTALLEAAHIARWSGDMQRARDFLLASQELEPVPVDLAGEQ